MAAWSFVNCCAARCLSSVWRRGQRSGEGGVVGVVGGAARPRTYLCEREDPEGALLGEVVEVQLRSEEIRGETCPTQRPRPLPRPRPQAPPSPEPAVGPRHQVVEDVEGGLALGPPAHPQLLQQHRLEPNIELSQAPPPHP